LTDKTIPVGVVGFGLAGRAFHAPVIHTTPGLRLAGVVQRSGDAAREIYSETRVVRSLDELLAIDDIRLVVIATPNVTHYEMARRCLLAGRDVVIDKPFTTTSQEAADLFRIAGQQGRLISAYHNSRSHGDFATVRQLLRSGALGRTVLCEIHYDRYRPKLRPGAWRERVEPGSGVFFDLGPHAIDQAMVLFGRPEAITADIRIEREAAVVDDAFDVTMHYPSLRVALRGGMLAVAPRPRFLLHGTQGAYVKYGVDPQEEALRRGEMPGGPDWGREPRQNWGTLYVSQEDGTVTQEAVPTEPGDYRRYYANVREAMLGHAALDVTPEQILDVMRALELAQQSSAERRTVTV
jgi:scyllo-inositol 2-dehydrogenase (NADP+)